MQRIKDYFKRIAYCWKYRYQNVILKPGCQLKSHGVELEGNNCIYQGASFSGKLGFGSYIGKRCDINAIIGRYCSIASDVKTIAGKHPTREYVSTHPAFFSINEQAGFTYVSESCFQEVVFADDQGHLVEIGNDVWIGSNALLLGGVHIGDGAIIAAGAVVCEDVPPYAIVGGVPAKVIRKRFSDAQIEKLLEIQWWNKSNDWLRSNAEKFKSIDLFLEDQLEMG